MLKMNIEIKTEHKLNKEDSKQKLLRELPLIQEQYSNELKNLTIDWLNDYEFDTSFLIMGMSFKGNGKLEDNNLISKLELPGAAALFYLRIKKALEDKLNKLLN